MEYVRSFSDKEFQAQYRLRRVVFNECLSLLDIHLKKNEKKALASSGSSVSPEMMFLITLRLLAGASYLDMIWYRVSVKHIFDSIIYPTLEAIIKCLPPISFPKTEVECQAIEQQWSSTLAGRHGMPHIKGTLAAGDGVAIEITQPKEKDLNGKDVKIYYNRKGYFALIAQAFCDAYGLFLIFDIRWPGATNDISCFRQTYLHQWVESGRLPEWAHFVLDEAYSCLGGPYLTPWTKAQLRASKAKECQEEYYARLAFNFFLSSQRITIERAFGMFLRRWGIMWRPLEHDIRHVVQIIKCCALLHNVCVRDWLLNRSRTTTERYVPVPPHHREEDEEELTSRIKW